MHALIDGDIVLYSCGFAAEKVEYSVYYENPDGHMQDITFDNAKEANAFLAENGGERIKHTLVQPLGYAIKNVRQLLEKIREQTGATEKTIFLTGKDNFRDEMVDYYKANRDSAHKPVHYEALKAFLINKEGAIVVDGQEADDAMAIAQYQDLTCTSSGLPEDNTEEFYKETVDTIICTRDKDLDMVPGWHYNWEKNAKYFVSEKGGMEFFYTQMLTGDSVDNIPGLYKLTGRKCTAQIKAGVKNLSEIEMWNYVRECYGKDVPEEKLIEIARLLWMRREPEQWWYPPNRMGKYSEKTY